MDFHPQQPLRLRDQKLFRGKMRQDRLGKVRYLNQKLTQKNGTSVNNLTGNIPILLFVLTIPDWAVAYVEIHLSNLAQVIITPQEPGKHILRKSIYPWIWKVYCIKLSNLTFYCKTPEDQMKPQWSRKKEIILRAEINEMKSGKTIKKIAESKCLSWQNQHNWPRIKERRLKLLESEMKEEILVLIV
jgi:hypothetical protein